jgi:hypothetical protein
MDGSLKGGLFAAGEEARSKGDDRNPNFRFQIRLRFALACPAVSFKFHPVILRK